MEFKGTKEKWVLVNDFNDLESEKGESIASFHWNYEDYHTTMVKNEIEGKHNALLISKATEMLEEIQDTIDELKLLKSTIIEASKTNNKLESVAEVIQNWIDRKEQLIKEATEL